MSEYSRFTSQAKRVLKVVGDVLEGAVASGNRREVVVRNKRSETLFKLSLTIVVLVALGVAYYFGYRAVIIRKGGPPY